MKQILLCTFFSLAQLGCSNSTDTFPCKDSHEMAEQPMGKKFFVYDAIDYYANDYNEEKLVELYDNQSKSALDSLKMGVLLGDIPQDISDLSFIAQLDKIGYKKSSVDKSKFAAIDKIFAEKAVSEDVMTSCIYVYRDILIFKKSNKVVGTAKICFGCMAHEITGTTAYTGNFGQDGDYRKLEDLLRKNGAGIQASR